MIDDFAKALASRNRQKKGAPLANAPVNASRREKFMTVYFSQAETTGLVKIGTTADLANRLRDLQAAFGPMAVLRTVQGGYLTEAWFHRRFSEYRFGREWFSYCADMLTAQAPDMSSPTCPRELDAFARDVLSFWPNLLRYAQKLLPADPEELVQKTIVKAIERHRLFEARTNLRAWLLTIMHNQAVNIYRDKSRRPTCGLSDRLCTLPTQEKHVLCRELVAIILASKTWGETFRLDLAGFEEKEAAAALGVADGTIKSRLSRARAALREACQ